MAEVSLIETADIPTSGRGGGSARSRLAEETLQRALRQNKSVRVILSADERANSVGGAYRSAAKRLGVDLVITGGPRRTYVNQRGGESQEPSVLYFAFARRAGAPAPATNGRTWEPVKPGEQTRVLAHGVEVNR